MSNGLVEVVLGHNHLLQSLEPLGQILTVSTAARVLGSFYWG